MMNDRLRTIDVVVATYKGSGEGFESARRLLRHPASSGLGSNGYRLRLFFYQHCNLDPKPTSASNKATERAVPHAVSPPACPSLSLPTCHGSVPGNSYSHGVNGPCATIVRLANVGRETHAYMHHALWATSQSDAADFFLFLQEGESSGLLDLIHCALGMKPTGKHTKTCAGRVPNLGAVNPNKLVFLAPGCHPCDATQMCLPLSGLSVAPRSIHAVGCKRGYSRMSGPSQDIMSALGRYNGSCPFQSPWAPFCCSRATFAISRGALKAVPPGSLARLFNLAADPEWIDVPTFNDHHVHDRKQLTLCEPLVRMRMGDFTGYGFEAMWSQIFAAGAQKLCGRASPEAHRQGRRCDVEPAWSVAGDDVDCGEHTWPASVQEHETITLERNCTGGASA